MMFLLLFVNGNELPASHSAHHLSFTAHSATTRGHCDFFSTLFESTEPRMHCEEQHKVEATLPDPHLFERVASFVCFMVNILISVFYPGTRACRINVVSAWLRSSVTSSTSLWLIEASKKGILSL